LDLDGKTRKLLTTHGVPHPRADFSHLYLSRKEGGRGLINVEDCVKLQELSLVDYLWQKEGETTKGCTEKEKPERSGTS